MGASETERGTDESNEGGGMTQDQIIQMLRKVINLTSKTKRHAR